MKIQRRGLLTFTVGTFVVVAGLLGTFSSVLLNPDRSTGLYDVYRYFGPSAYLMDRAIHSGHVPLWNPYIHCGMPFAANPQNAFFYPPNILRSLLTFSQTPQATHIGLCLLTGLHMMLAFLGTFLLARAHGASRSGGLGAATAFTFSALMVRRACEYHFITSLAWLPLILYFLKQAMDSDRRGRVMHSILAGILFAFSILAGFLQITAYLALAAVFYTVLYPILIQGRGRPSGKRRRLVLDVFLVLTLFAVTAAILGAALIVPAAELSSFADRQQGRNIKMYSNLSQETLLEFMQEYIVYPGLTYKPEAVRNSGAIALLLAAAGLLMYPRRERLLFFGMYVVFLDCSFGPPFPFATVLTHAVPFAMSAYTRAYDAALLPLSILTGFGVDAVLRNTKSAFTRTLRSILLLFLGILLLIGLWIWAYPHPYLDVSKWVIWVPMAALIIMVAAGWIRRYSIVAPALVGLLLSETILWNTAYVEKLVGRSTQAAYSAKFTLTNQRVFDWRPNLLLYTLQPQMTGYDPLNLLRTRAASIGNSEIYHRSVSVSNLSRENKRGYLFLKRRFWLARNAFGDALPPIGTLYPSATTVFLPNAGRMLPRAVGIPRTAVSPDTYSVAPSGKPRFGKVGCSLLFHIPTEVAGKRVGPARCFHSSLFVTCTTYGPASFKVSFDDVDRGVRYPGISIFLDGSREPAAFEVPMPDIPNVRVNFQPEEPANAEISIEEATVRCDMNDEDYLMKILDEGPNHAELEVGPLSSPRMLLFVDSYYPGWMATVDGEPMEIMLANDAFKAVALPAGTHRVVFEFRPWRVYAGASISAGGASLLLTLALLYRRRQAAPQAD